MPNSDFIHSFVSTLNHALSKDRKAVQKVVLEKTPAEYDFTNDPDIIVGVNNTLSGLSLINSMISAYCGKRIVACIDDNGVLIKFEVMK